MSAPTTATAAVTSVQYPTQAPAQGPLAPIANAAHFIADKIGGIGAPTIASTATPAPIFIYTPEQLEAIREQDLAINTFYAKMVEDRESIPAFQAALKTLESSRATSSYVSGTVQDTEKSLNAATAVAATQVFASVQTSAERARGDQEAVDQTHQLVQQEYNREYKTRFSMQEGVIKAHAAMQLAMLKANYLLGLPYDPKFTVPADAKVLTVAQLQLKAEKNAAINAFNAALQTVRTEDAAIAKAKEVETSAQEALNHTYTMKVQADTAYEAAKTGTDQGLIASTASDALRYNNDYNAAGQTLRSAQETIARLTASKLKNDEAFTEARGNLENITRVAAAQGV